MGRNVDIETVEKTQHKNELPPFRVGDTLKANLRIVEDGGKERVQSFSGTCIARKATGISETITIHRIAYGEGMERVFFVHSPLIVSVELVRRGSVRRNKLYYLRGTSGKAAKVKGRYASTPRKVAAEQAPEQEEQVVEQEVQQL